MPVAAVLGWPLAHTSSPALHTAAYLAAGPALAGWRYEARPTRPERLAAALAEVRDGTLAGVNLTTPHKRAALGAVNTVVARPGGRRGPGHGHGLAPAGSAAGPGPAWPPAR